MTQIVWTRPALQDRETIYDHIERDNATAALTLDLLFSDAAQRLAVHPELGRVGRVSKTRELVVHPNYILVYDLWVDRVRILRVLHAARQWPQPR